MDIKNIALIRATNIIPFDGVVHPISEVPYLRKENVTEFSAAMRDLLRRKGLLKEVDWTKPDEIDDISKENIAVPKSINANKINAIPRILCALPRFNVSLSKSVPP